MIERIEIVKGGGSSLYGSSAIGGVVNVITKRPSLNSYNVNYNFNVINNLSTDNVLSGNSSVVVSDDIGVSFFVNSRKGRCMIIMTITILNYLRLEIIHMG